MVCEMTISARGRVSGFKFYEGVMHSHARFTYTQVGQILAERGQKRSGIRKQFHQLTPHLDCLQDLYTVLLAARKKRGAIEFETQETRILFDDERKIQQIIPVVRNDAHKLIEECMLAANVCAANFLEKHELPALYRVHESPKEQKLALLKEFLAGLGLPFPSVEQVTPQLYQSVLASVKGRSDANIIQTVMLRSMNQAVYQPENRGHFGLAYEAYAHFTSPIRRYPDLLVHRAIRSVIRSNTESKQVERVPKVRNIAKKRIYPYSLEDMLTLGEQCSLTERRADDATRDVVSWLKCEYLRTHVGEVFKGVVSSVTSFGLFVELNDIYIEGLVHITALPKDYYHHEAAHHVLVGERTQREFALGDSITVQVARVDLDERKIDFDWVADGEGPNRKHKKKGKVPGASKRRSGVKAAQAKSASKVDSGAAKSPSKRSSNRRNKTRKPQ